MKDIEKILVIRSGNGATYMTHHTTREDAERLYKGLWNCRSYHVEVQTSYLDGTTEIIKNY